jgi:hypothetical protein
MKVLFDNGTPKPIAKVLIGHEVTFARQVGWHELRNGDLIRIAEDSGYEVFLTTDKQIRYQQNLAERKIGLVVLGYSQWPAVQRCLAQIVDAVNSCRPGDYVEVEIPYR